jgi:hypothetical protein
MSAADDRSPGFSLRRWSQRKLAAAQGAPGAKPAPSASVPPPARAPSGPAASTAPSSIPAPDAATATPAAALPPAGAAASPGREGAAPAANALPSVETLTFDSDFTAFLQPKVDEAVRRSALRRLFRDPRFNVMDGLDVYIDDYSIPDPISAERVRDLVQSRYIFEPPPTRINAAGWVEDVPPEDRAVTPATAGVEVQRAPAVADGSTTPLPPSQAATPDAIGAETGARDAAPGAPSGAVSGAAEPAADAPVTRPDRAPRADR